MQLHHDFLPEADARSREAEDRARQGHQRRAARGDEPGSPAHALLRSLAAVVSIVRHKATSDVTEGAPRRATRPPYAHGAHRPHA